MRNPFEPCILHTIRQLAFALASVAALVACAPMDPESEDESGALQSFDPDDEEDDELGSQSQALADVTRCGSTCREGEYIKSTSCVDMPDCRIGSQASCINRFNSVICSPHTDDFWTCEASCPSGYILKEFGSSPSPNCNKLNIVDGRLRHCVRDTTPPLPPAVKFVLQHSGGQCIHPKGGAARPAKKTPAVLHPLCTQEPRLQFEHESWKAISHVSSGFCLQPEDGSANPPRGTRLVYSDKCGSTIRSTIATFELTASGSLRHTKSGLCVHPRGGSANPAVETELILWDGCDEPRLRFHAVQP